MCKDQSYSISVMCVILLYRPSVGHVCCLYVIVRLDINKCLLCTLYARFHLVYLSACLLYQLPFYLAICKQIHCIIFPQCSVEKIFLRSSFLHFNQAWRFLNYLFWNLFYYGMCENGIALLLCTYLNKANFLRRMTDGVQYAPLFFLVVSLSHTNTGTCHSNRL